MNETSPQIVICNQELQVFRGEQTSKWLEVLSIFISSKIMSEKRGFDKL